MRYNPRARLDRSQVRVRRGGGSGAGGIGFPVGGRGGGLRVGGGIGGVIVVVVILLLQSGVLTGGGSSGGTDAGGGSGTLNSCRTGADANQNEQCALLADVNSIQAFWASELPRQAGVRYTHAPTYLFSGTTQTGCGSASSAVGPFYCPVDKHVYLDTSFFRDMLQGQLGARGGPFSEAYVLAHEYGHHVQDLLGTMSRVRTQQGPASDSVRLELQADCYAGIWAKHATTVRNADGQVFIEDLTPDDVRRALDAARAVGDDRIQRETSGHVNPDQWTHGSAVERVRWFNTGLQQGTLRACDTFSAPQL
jgi:predicted metalloprotease